MRQPAGAAERGRREECAPCVEAGGPQSLRPVGESRIDVRRDNGILEPDYSIAFDERDDDVLAAQAGEQLVARGVTESVTLELVREDRAISDAGAHRAYLVHREGGGARRGKRHAGDELRPERPAKDPDGAERRDGTERPAAVAGRDPGQAKHRQGREDEYADDEHGRAGHDEVGVPRSDRVAQRLDADPGVPPVGNGIERPVEGRVDAHVEDLHDHQQPENRSDDPGEYATTLGGQGEGQRENGDRLRAGVSGTYWA